MTLQDFLIVFCLEHLLSYCKNFYFFLIEELKMKFLPHLNPASLLSGDK